MAATPEPKPTIQLKTFDRIEIITIVNDGDNEQTRRHPPGFEHMSRVGMSWQIVSSFSLTAPAPEVIHKDYWSTTRITPSRDANINASRPVFVNIPSDDRADIPFLSMLGLANTAPREGLPEVVSINKENKYVRIPPWLSGRMAKRT